MKRDISKFWILALSFLLLIIFAESLVRLNPRLYCLGYKPSENERIVYELLAGYEISALNAHISSQGLNDRYFSVIKPAGVYRMAVVGDSTSFGWKVGPQNSFPKMLEDMLNEKIGRRFEVINFSVPGYNTYQELELIKEKVLEFNPDMMILVFHENDINLCNYFKPEITMLNYLYNKSYFIRFLLYRLDRLSSKFSSHKRIIKLWMAFKRNILGMFHPDDEIYPYPGLEHIPYARTKFKESAPPRYLYMLGYENFKIHLSEINSLLKEKGIKFISSGFFTKAAMDINKKLGVKFICDFRSALEIKGRSDIYLPDDGHLNIEGHYLAAAVLYEYLQKNLTIQTSGNL